MGKSDVMLSNVIGAPFSKKVLGQLYTRAALNSTTVRTPEQVLFLANKTAWVRLISSIDIVLPTPTPGQPASQVDYSKYYAALGVDMSPNNTIKYETGTSLANNWVLEAGTSIANGDGITLRSGLGGEGSYGLGGIYDQGYRPMPGLTSVTIDTAGRLGSLRYADINFKVWNIDQLNVVEALYFRLGYSMLLEWGHTQYYKNDGQLVLNDVYGITNPFQSTLRKEAVQQQIASKSNKTDYNYDGMLGIVTNFTWAFNQEGGYDCTVKLIGLGAIIDSLRINQAYKLPPGLITGYRNAKKALDAYNAEQAARAAYAANPQSSGAGTTSHRWYLPTTLQNLRDQLVAGDGYPSAQTATNLGAEIAYYPAARVVGAATKFPDYYVKAQTAAAINAGADNYLGLFISQLNTTIVNDPTTKITRVGVGSTFYWNTALSEPFAGTFLNDVTYPQEQANVYSQTALGTNLSKAYAILLARAVRKAEFTRTTTGTISNIVDFFTRQGSTAAVTKYLDLLQVDVAVGTGILKLGDVLSDGYEATNFDYKTSYYNEFVTGNPNAVNIQPKVGLSTFEAAVAFKNAIEVGIDPTTNKPILKQKDFTTTLKVALVDNSSNYIYDITFYEIVRAIDSWVKGQTAKTGTPLTITNIKTSGGPAIEKKSVFVTATSAVNIQPNTVNYLASRGANNGPAIKDPALANTKNPDPIRLEITLTTNSTSFILPAAAATPNPSATNQAGAGSGGNTSGATNTARSDQDNDAFESALVAMLAYVKTTTQAASPGKDVYEHSLLYDKKTNNNPTKVFYGDGVLQKLDDNDFKPKPAFVETLATGSFELTKYARKGFNAALMSNETLYGSVPDVDFSKICKSYLVAYGQGASNPAMSSVYIPFGYLLAFLNNMCLIYDTTADKSTAPAAAKDMMHPYLYIDFNPETNLCLTAPQHMSIDPSICLIPFQGGNTDYESIYDPAVWGGIKDKWNPQKQNRLNAKIPPFKVDGRKFTGKMMNILLNVDYLIKLTTDFATADPEHTVNLKRFLETLVVDINKALGNFNLFRVAYVDESNTVQIRDDQYVPNPNQSTILERATYLQTTYNENSVSSVSAEASISSLRYGQLPIFGVQSLVRTFQFKTNLSTKLASMIAISAQAETGSVNAKDGSSLAYLNKNYQDRFKPRVVNPPSPNNNTSGKSNTTTNNNDLTAAQTFNTHVKSIYDKFENYDPLRTIAAKNYYIERSALVKTNSDLTVSAPFIPADCELTIDGIGGIIMGQAFTIPEDRLPKSLRDDKDDYTKVGFIVAGLTHTIDNNEWLTKIKGQMIRLRQNTAEGDLAVIDVLQPRLVQGLRSGRGAAVGSIVVSPDKLKYLYEQFKAVGLNQAAAAGAAGTMYAESGLDPTAWIIGATSRNGSQTTTSAGSALGQSLDPQSGATFTRPTYNGRRITAYGIAQWTSAGDFLENYIVFANANGGDSYENQVKYAVKTMQQRSVFNKLKTVANTEDGAVEAAGYWLDYYEFVVPYITDPIQREKRYNHALGAYNIIKNF